MNENLITILLNDLSLNVLIIQEKLNEAISNNECIDEKTSKIKTLLSELVIAESKLYKFKSIIESKK